MTPRSLEVSTACAVDYMMGTSRLVILLNWCLEPSHITWVLVGFNRRRLVLIQSSTSTRQREKCSSASGASPTNVERYTWQSSAYWCKIRPWVDTTWWSSAVYITKSSGSEDWSLWYTELEWLHWRQLPVIQDLLHSTADEWSHSLQDPICQTTLEGQSLQQKSVIDAVECCRQVEQPKQRHLLSVSTAGKVMSNRML